MISQLDCPLTISHPSVTALAVYKISDRKIDVTGQGCQETMQENFARHAMTLDHCFLQLGAWETMWPPSPAGSAQSPGGGPGGEAPGSPWNFTLYITQKRQNKHWDFLYSLFWVIGKSQDFMTFLNHFALFTCLVPAPCISRITMAPYIQTRHPILDSGCRESAVVGVEDKVVLVSR